MTDLKQIINQYNDLHTMVTTNQFNKASKQYSEKIKRFNKLLPIVNLYNNIILLDSQIASIVDTDEQTLQYVELLKQDKQVLVEQLNELTFESDPLDDLTEIIVQIRAGAGGDQGALFAYDLFRMYDLFAKKSGWSIKVSDINQFATQSDQQAIKRVIFNLYGIDVYKKMKYESGIHRIIRNPITDGGDRTHTSSATVAILPVVTDVQFELNMGDLRIDYYRGTGKGGQHRNTTDSACRIVHIPTNTMVTCEDERSQPQNKERALTQLRTRLYNTLLAQQQKNISQQRKQLVGRGDWSSRIRTYNFKKQQFFDHRINYMTTRLYQLMNGDMDQLITNLQIAYKNTYKENI